MGEKQQEEVSESKGYIVPEMIQRPVIEITNQEPDWSRIENMVPGYWAVYQNHIDRHNHSIEAEGFAQETEKFFQSQESLDPQSLKNLGKLPELSNYVDFDYPDNFMGYFISGLINRSLDAGTVNMDLRKNTTGKSLHNLGFGLKAGITLNIYYDIPTQEIGSMGKGLNGGTINYWGFPYDAVGADMKAGEINIFGDSGYRTGIKMKGGRINVYGDLVAPNIGEEMTGGEIRVRGNIYHEIVDELLYNDFTITSDQHNSCWKLITPKPQE